MENKGQVCGGNILDGLEKEKEEKKREIEIEIEKKEKVKNSNNNNNNNNNNDDDDDDDEDDESTFEGEQRRWFPVDFLFPLLPVLLLPPFRDLTEVVWSEKRSNTPQRVAELRGSVGPGYIGPGDPFGPRDPVWLADSRLHVAALQIVDCGFGITDYESAN
uniref:Uncharacterized protein n=1 Tax=Vespula pensylvanica TaxID=30213 RepID=A0A834JZ61_VESPE|nr:hypothetical protein H0235_016901 [Vespula pensylvanica]